MENANAQRHQYIALIVWISAYTKRVTQRVIKEAYQYQRHRVCKLNCVNAHRLKSHQKRKFYEQHR